MSTMPAPPLAGDLTPAFCDLSGVAAFTLPVAPVKKADLTIHRRTDTHHGATLRVLGHAAEYLVESRMFVASDGKADAEAVQILMRLSREIFEEYAEGGAVRKRFQDWVMDRVVQVYD